MLSSEPSDNITVLFVICFLLVVFLIRQRKRYGRLNETVQAKDNEISTLEKQSSELEHQLNKQKSELLALQDKYSFISNLESEEDKLSKSISKIKSEYKDKRELLDKIVEKIDFYTEELNSYDLGEYLLPDVVVSSGEYVKALKACQERSKQWLKDWKEKYKESSNKLLLGRVENMRDLDWFFMPREIVDYWSDSNLRKNRAAINIVWNNQMHFLHYFSYMMDDIIKKITLRNLEASKKKVEIAAAHVRAFGTTVDLLPDSAYQYTRWVKDNRYVEDINRDYLKLKHEELKLTHKILVAKAVEKEKVKEAKKVAKAQEDAQKEYEKALKEEREYEDEIRKRQQLVKEMHGDELNNLQLEIQRLEAMLASTVEDKIRAESMAQMTKAGYVYIISNIGSFGEGVVKIGMTRRPDPSIRVKELGDASVPFTFDTHALIYSEDAPALEKALHKRFFNERVNKVNQRKEFFRANIDDVKKAVLELANDAQFVTDTKSIEYFKTLQLSSIEKNNPRHKDLDDFPDSI